MQNPTSPLSLAAFVLPKASSPTPTDLALVLAGIAILVAFGYFGRAIHHLARAATTIRMPAPALAAPRKPRGRGLGVIVVLVLIVLAFGYAYDHGVLNHLASHAATIQSPPTTFSPAPTPQASLPSAAVTPSTCTACTPPASPKPASHLFSGWEIVVVVFLIIGAIMALRFSPRRRSRA
jgi:hypothetical protein